MDFESRAEEEEEAAPVKPGDIIAGKYEVTRVVAHGGMGVVVAARHTELGHPVALKFLLPSALFGPDAVPRFHREARAVVQMKSEHVVRVSDVGTLSTGAPYLVMELLDGLDLKDVLDEEGPLSLERACDYIIQASEALAEAHITGIVHRDIKPPNLFMTKRADGTPLIKVLDFGIAKAIGDPLRVPDGVKTATNAIMGSPQYMSPEQVRSTKNVDARTDVWALGTVLFEILTGRPAFNGASFGELFEAIINQPHRPARDLRPDLPKEIDDVFNRCFEKDPANRMQNVAELATALAPFAPTSSLPEVDRINRMFGLPPVSSRFMPESFRREQSGGSAPPQNSQEVPDLILGGKKAASSPSVTQALPAPRAPQTPPPSNTAPVRTGNAWGSTRPDVIHAASTPQRGAQTDGRGGAATSVSPWKVVGPAFAGLLLVIVIVVGVAGKKLFSGERGERGGATSTTAMATQPPAAASSSSSSSHIGSSLITADPSVPASATAPLLASAAAVSPSSSAASSATKPVTITTTTTVVTATPTRPVKPSPSSSKGNPIEMGLQ